MTNSEIYRSFFNAASEACLFIKAGLILDCNPKGLSLFGCSREEIIGISPHHFSPPRQPDGSDSAVLANRKIADAFDSGRQDYSWRLQRLSGEEFSAQVTLEPLKIHGEDILLARIRDLAGIHSQGDAPESGCMGLEQSQKLESLGMMAGGLAHDFNNYLLAIMGNADLVDRDLAAGRNPGELLSEIRKATRRAAELCNQLLAYAGKGHSHFQLIDLSLTVQEMVQMIKVAIARKIVLRLELAPDLPLIEGDVPQIHQLIMNLVVNASEAIVGKSGEVTLATRLSSCVGEKPEHCLLSRDMGEGPHVLLEVRDTGEGMDRETCRRIVDPYFTTKIRGRGLGLSSVLGTLRSHQGSFCVQSSPGEGSVFRACFPAAGLSQPRVSTQTGQKVARIGKGTILIVDDEEYLRVLCSRMLQRMGYTVLLAADGAQALELFRQEKGRIDGVVLDLVMPVMDGVEVLAGLLDLDPSAKVIMTSGYHEREIATRFSGRGIAGFIQKPYVMSDLGQVLGEIIIPRERPDQED